MEILLSLFYFLLFSFVIYKWNFFALPTLKRKIIVLIFLLKVLAGIGMMLIYTYYYTDRMQADIFKFFDDSKIMTESLKENPVDFLQMMTGIGDEARVEHYYHRMNFWYRYDEETLFNDNHTIIRFNAMVRIFSLGYFTVHIVFMCFLSLIGLIFLYKTFEPYFFGKSILPVLAVFFWPSLMFWGSGVLKEGLLLLGLGTLVYQVHYLAYNPFRATSVVLLLLSVFLLTITKYYVLAAVSPALLAYFIVGRMKWDGYLMVGTYLTVFAVAVLFALNFHHFKEDFNTLEVLSAKQRDFINLSDSLQSGSRIEMERLRPTLGSFVRNSPKAILNTLFRPHIFEIRKPLYILTALETAATVIAILLLLFFRKKTTGLKNQLLLSFSVVISLSLLVGLLTPILGAIVRYKIPMLPFLGVFFVLWFDAERFKNFVLKQKK